MSRRPEAVLQPVGALFEAAFKRFGSRFAAYLGYAAAFGTLPLGAALALRQAGAHGYVALGLFGLAFGAAHLGLAGVLTALVAGRVRARATAIAVVAIGAGAVTGACLATFPPLAVLAYPVLAFAAIAVAADASAARSFPVAVRLVGANLGRAYLVVCGIALWTAGAWFGCVIALSPVGDPLQRQLAFALTCLIVWPVAVLVERNLYGDLTGRLVIRASPGAAERDARLQARRPTVRRRRR